MSDLTHRLMALAISIAILNGCVVGGRKVRYSNPTMDDPAIPAHHVKWTPVDRMFILNAVAVYVYPANEINEADVIVFPYPSSTSVPHNVARPFTVGVGFKPSQPGFSIDISQIRLLGFGPEGITAARIIGPTECSADHHSADWRSAPVTCIPLPEGICTSFSLSFELDTPDPSAAFAVELGGATLDGVPYAIPAIQFHDKHRVDPIGAP